LRFIALLAVLVLAPSAAHAEVQALETGGFGLDRNVTVAARTQVYDMISRDLPLVGPQFSAHPKALTSSPGRAAASTRSSTTRATA
jgi:hypothetical protein